MIKIESLQNEKVKNWLKLKDKKYRDLENLFLIEGEHLLEEGLKHHVVKEIITSEEKEYDLKTYWVSKSIIKKLSNQETPPVVLAVCEKLKEKEIKGNVLALDNIQDPGNLGTILRSSLAFQNENILLGNNCVDLYNPKVIRSTEGMFFDLNILRKPLVEEIKKLKEQGYTILGTDVNQGVDIRCQKIKAPICLVIGNEGKGLSEEVRDLCEEFCYIPMDSKAESLNASVSASILLYEINRWNHE